MALNLMDAMFDLGVEPEEFYEALDDIRNPQYLRVNLYAAKRESEDD